MVDQNLHRDFFDPRRVHQELLVLDLEIEIHVEIGKPAHQAGGLAVVVVTVESRIDRGANDAARLVLLQRRNVRIEVNDGDPLETPLACFNRIEHAGIVASVTRIWLHEERMLDVVAIHYVTKLRSRADLLPGWLVRNVLTIGKLDRIDHMDMAIDLRLIENRHVCGRMTWRTSERVS